MAPRTPKDPENKPAKPAKSAAKSKPSGDATVKPALKVVDPAPAADPKGAALKLKDLIDGVATATGGKKPEVKKIVEATLAALGEALATGKALAVPPLGKLRVVKNKGPALTLKLRLADGAKAAGLALADDGEDS
jgi:Bacterial DNA-binding protein